jgi:glycosyltransferase involved in cell wall biosynthesis
MKRILFTHYGENHIRGSERCLLNLIKHLDRGLFTPIVWCNSELLEQEVKDLQIHVIRSNFPILFGWLPSRYDFRGFLDIVKQGLKIVSEERIDLIHANSGAPNQWLNLIARIRKLPLVSHLHSRYPLRDRLTLGLLNTSLAVGVSQPVVKQLLNDGLAPDQVKIIPNGIDANQQDKAAPVDLRILLNLEQQDFVAITVGSLIHRKGIDVLIRAIAGLRNRELPVHLVIVGDGPEKPTLENLSQKYNLQNYVHFLGERTDVAGLLRGGADVFVSGAREEVFGLVLAEANLASIPVIAPCVGGIPEVIENNVTGILIPPENSAAVANAVQHLYKNPKLKNKLGLSGRQRVLENFNVEKYVLRFQSTYLDLIQDQKKYLGFFKNGNLLVISKMLSRALLINFNKSSNSTGTKSYISRPLSQENW